MGDIALSDPDELLTPTQAAMVACVHINTIRRWIRLGWLGTRRVGRNFAIRRGDVEALSRERGHYKVGGE